MNFCTIIYSLIFPLFFYFVHYKDKIYDYTGRAKFILWQVSREDFVECNEIIVFTGRDFIYISFSPLFRRFPQTLLTSRIIAPRRAAEAWPARNLNCPSALNCCRWSLSTCLSSILLSSRNLSALITCNHAALTGDVRRSCQRKERENYLAVKIEHYVRIEGRVRHSCVSRMLREIIEGEQKYLPHPAFLRSNVSLDI